MLNSTRGFLDSIKDFCFKPTDILVSFDVESLFTNVPLSETITIIADTVYSQENIPSYSKDTFIKLLEKATSGIFMYKDKLFRQVDGVTMGGPLGPNIANFCLAHLESRLLTDPDIDVKPALYLRYVDDLFCVFRVGSSYV